MPALACDPRALVWSDGSFRPTGDLQEHGAWLSVNPAAKQKRGLLSGRIIVGFNVGRRRVWTLARLMKLVRQLRLAQGAAPSAPFLAQHGIYRHDAGAIGTEKGAQVILFNFGGLKLEDFAAKMLGLAKEVAIRFKQESVYVEIQKDGRQVEFWRVVPE